ncbi:fumarylacetoacetate hydrolase family protein [Fusibacter ferrireducens]|uniref:Fumarylacetoacetate hydrolase family protein n=1 Tax=Fusibacter ferrireducens TaxID=2785058 RepID=A0ABR9ZYW6_9FIRM|nr:fumarylacetoacetate hydrolase family protein [Fusibacter ferrireducens]MBF4695651.1 fumarylacetoacetate hydrolase family protein [Fusibacter ferrireducens]
MKIGNCMYKNEKIGYCVIELEYVYPINAILGIEMDQFSELVENWEDIRSEIQKKINSVQGISIGEVSFLAPITKPVRNLICIGKNYLDHAKELEGKTANLTGIPKEPIYFSKMAHRILGPSEDFIIDASVTKEVDYEVELGLIIKKECKDVLAKDVQDVIFGYAVFNDYSARDLQTKHIQWHRGKSLDYFTAMGPYIITADEVAFPPSLKITSKINGELRQNGLTDQLIFPIATLIEDFSKGTTLIPGDIIITGTPSGVGMGFNPPKYLKHSDCVECEIEGMGKICNVVVIKN